MSILSTPTALEDVGARGHSLLEGPRIGADGALLFCDVLQGGAYRRDPDGTITELVPKRRGIGGLLEHAGGGVVVGGRTLIHHGAGTDRLLLEREDVTGFNDLFTAAGGAVLAGALRYRPMAGEPAVPGLLLRVDAPGAATVISERLLWPNGIGAAPDGARLYVSDFARKHVLAMAPDGTGEAVFAEVPRGSADGLAVDEEGGVWVALGDGCGVVRFTADGALDEVVDVPAEFVSSIAFGGQDRRDVAITTVGAVFVARSEVAGVRVEPAAV